MVRDVRGGLDENDFGRLYCPYVFDTSTTGPAALWDPTKSDGSSLWVSSIFSRPEWNQSYFHWHRNFLTRLVVLQELGLRDLNVVVAEKIPDYKWESLRELGVSKDRIMAPSELAGRVVENVLFVTNVDRQELPYPGDVVRPSALRHLASKLLEGAPPVEEGQETKLYVMRGDGVKRRVTNEPEIVDLLSGHGFRAVDPGQMSYWEQVALFSAASEVIAPHGAAITNVLFSTELDLLEFAPAGHGARPDYFQLAAAVGSRYSMCVVPSENDNNDITIPLEAVESWLGQKGPRRNSVFTLGD